MASARLLLAGLFACIAHAHGAEPPIDLEQVAKAFDVPVSSIRRTVKTDEVASKHGDSIYSASLFEFESAPNVSMQVIVTKGHFLLSESLRSKLDEEPAMMEKVEMENDGTAFVGNEGAGPGAEGYVAIGHLPSQNVDFRLRVMISNDGVSASDISSLGVVRSSPLLKKALKLLAIASSVKLSQSPTDSSASTARGTQPVKPSAIPNWNAQGIEKVSTQNSHQRVVPEPEPKAWKTFSLALVVAFSLLFLANYWKMRRNLKNRGEDHVK